MAKINKQEIIQKLVDDLNLYPGKDLIPSELADKILATYQINTDDINVILKPNYYLWQDLTLNDSDKTLTVPDNHTYVIKNFLLKYSASADAGNREVLIIVQDSAGNDVWVGDFSNASWNIPASRVVRFVGNIAQDIIVADGSANAFNYIIPMPNLVLKENYTFRVYDVQAIAAAADDMEITIMVEDITD